MQNWLGKLRWKFISIKIKSRISLYRSLGMKIGKVNKLSSINVEWPGSVEIGDYCEIQNNTTFWIKRPFDENCKIIIGNHVFIGRNTEFNCTNNIRIGDNCLIASSTVFVDSSHKFLRGQTISSQPIDRKEIVIEEDVWIGTGSKILGGVQLGRGCIIGANALVNKSVPEYEIWAGVPAKKIGERKP